MKNIKKVLVLSLVVLLLVGCTDVAVKNKKELLTEDNVKELESVVYITNDAMSYKTVKNEYVNQVISVANSKISSGKSEVADVKEFTRFEYISGGKADDYNYQVNGKLYGTNDFGSQVVKNVKVSFHCEKKDSTNCNVYYDGFEIVD